MAEQSFSVNVEQLSWTRVLPFIHIFKSFVMALHPSRMILALVMVVLLFACGHAMDLVGGQTVFPGEINAYATMSPIEFEQWLTEQNALDENLALAEGVFKTLVKAKINCLNQLVEAGGNMNFGMQTRSADISQHSVKQNLVNLLIVLPGWMWSAHKLYFILFSIISLFIWALFAGAISRSAALHASNNMRQSIADSIRFARKRFLWFIITPLLLPALASILGLIFNTLLFGLPFNWPVTDTIAGMFFVIALVFGCLITLALIVNALAAGLYYPAIAVDDADAFDAIGHGVNYVIGRFFAWLFYSVVAFVFGVFTYLIVAAVVVTVLKVTSGFVSLGVFSDRVTAADTLQSFALQPKVTQVDLTGADLQEMNVATTSASWLVRMWASLFVGLLAAYAYSYFICANTWIYLLLRKSADGTEMDDIYSDE